jgi:hypothetical protein
MAGFRNLIDFWFSLGKLGMWNFVIKTLNLKTFGFEIRSFGAWEFCLKISGKWRGILTPIFWREKNSLAILKITIIFYANSNMRITINFHNYQI